MKRACFSLLCAMMVILAGVSSALCEDGVYYINPDGGQFYHTDHDCPSISERYLDTLVAMTAAQLEGTAYAPCPICGAPALSERTYEEPLPIWKPAYDTADPDTRIQQAGKYAVGTDLAAGMYTIRTDAAFEGSIQVTMGDRLTRAFTLTGENSCSLYLGDGMRLTLPERCTLETIQSAREFQDMVPVPVAWRRYALHFELPYLEYDITALGSDGGQMILYSIAAEMGLEEPTIVDIPAGATVTYRFTSAQPADDPDAIVPTDQEYYFVEFVNCVVQRSEEGNG